MLLRTTERTAELHKDLKDNLDKLTNLWIEDQSDDTLALLNDANNYLAIFEMTLDTLDESPVTF